MADEDGKKDEIRIAAAMSIPRVGFNDSWGAIHDAFRPFGIPVRRYTGAFWDQCLERVLDRFVDDDLDWVITVDYDTVFTSKHLDHLFATLANDESLDAVSALQRKRNHTSALLTVPGAESGEITVDGSPIRVATSHFGLTVIRVEALKRMPKPWFLPIPAANGSYTDEPTRNVDSRWNETRRQMFRLMGVDMDQASDHKIDPDVFFWRRWASVGNTVAICPQVRVGHLEVRCTDFDQNLDPRESDISDWFKYHKVEGLDLGTPEESRDGNQQQQESANHESPAEANA